MSIFGTMMSKVCWSEPSGASPEMANGRPVESATSAARWTPFDVEKVLDDMQADASQGLDWRHSIVDLMTLLDVDASLSARKTLADELSYDGDRDDTASMNVWLHRAILAGFRGHPIGVHEDDHFRTRAAEDEILSRVQKWAGGRQKARDWYRNFEIPSLGNKTAETLANDGHIDALRRYLDRISCGGFA